MENIEYCDSNDINEVRMKILLDQSERIEFLQKEISYQNEILVKLYNKINDTNNNNYFESIKILKEWFNKMKNPIQNIDQH